MKKIFNLDGKSIEIDLMLKVNIELNEAEQEYVCVEFESESDDLIIEQDAESLTIKSKENEGLFQDLKNIRSFGGFIDFALKNASNQQAIEGTAKIGIPKNFDGSFSLKANNAIIVVETQFKDLYLKANSGSIVLKNNIDNLELKLNSGDISIQGDIENCDIKGNNISLQSKANIRVLQLKTNKGIINLSASNKVKNWDIKSNAGNITITKNDFCGDILKNTDGSSTKDAIIYIKTSGFASVL